MAKSKRTFPAYLAAGHPVNRSAGIVFPQISTLSLLKLGEPMQTFPVVALLQSLTDLLANLYVGGNVIKLHLFKSNTFPSIGDVLATYTEADFAGYASQNLVQVGAPYVNPTGVPEQDFQLLAFADTNATVPNTVYGYYVGLAIGAGPETLLWAERFATPLDFTIHPSAANIAAVLTLQTEF